jgi:hypothetical protein
MYCIQRSFTFTDQIIRQSRQLTVYQVIFDVLDLSAIPDRMKELGRKGYSIHAMIRALIVKHRERIESIPRLIDYLDGNPYLAELCGFTPGVIPGETAFYRLLGKLPHPFAERTLHTVNKALIEKGAVTLDTFLMDSKPVLAASADNNIKNPGRNLTDKTKKPARNPRAALGYLAKAPDGGKTLFWGYRTHVITSGEGIPLVEVTHPNNVPDSKVAGTLINKLKRVYHFNSGAAFIGDAAYDVNGLYELIIDKYNCTAFIALNPRAAKNPHTTGEHSRPVCDAGLEMVSDGRWVDPRRHTIKHKFICPLKVSASRSKLYPAVCPAGCPKFAGYGCTKYQQQSYSARNSVPRGTERFQYVYSHRIIVEQYFARLGTLEAYQTSHYRLNAIRNQVTIAHLTHSIIALAALHMGHKESFRCYRSLFRVA